MTKAIHLSTTEKASWVSGTAPELMPTSSADTPDLRVTAEETISWQGFGGCFNELGSRALKHLSPKDRTRVLDDLFSPDGELRFEFCRTPIGANDYSEDWYSLAEVAEDFELQHFSIERDRRHLLPFIKEALRRQPGLTLFASPWSPPTWLKRPAVFNFGKLILEPLYLEAYARYFLKYVQAYAEEGVTVQQIHVQNEPVSSQKFPSCVITGEEFALFIGKYLGPLFEREKCPTEIWLGTINGPETDERKSWSSVSDYAFAVMEDAEAGKYVKGISYQWAGKYAVWRTRLGYPELPLIQSENECGDGQNTWAYAWYVADLLHHYLAQDVCAYVYWNMILEPEGISTWGWKQNSLYTADPATGTLTVNPEYHIMRHYSAFIRRGDRRLVCQRPWATNALAFKSTAASAATTVVVRNPFTRERTVTVETPDKKMWRVDLPAQSINTVRLPV